MKKQRKQEIETRKGKRKKTRDRNRKKERETREGNKRKKREIGKEKEEERKKVFHIPGKFGERAQGKPGRVKKELPGKSQKSIEYLLQYRYLLFIHI